MTLSRPFHQIADVIQAIERIDNGNVELVLRDGNFTADKTVGVDLDIRIPLDINSEDVRIDLRSGDITDGWLELQVTTQALIENGAATKSTSVRESKDTEGESRSEIEEADEAKSGVREKVLARNDQPKRAPLRGTKTFRRTAIRCTAEGLRKL